MMILARIGREKTVHDTFCGRLRELRRKNGYTQASLAKALGVSQTTISSWEAGSWVPNFDNLERIAKIFGVPVGYLLGEEETCEVGKSCNACVSRFICPIQNRTCDGYNDENFFWALIKLHFPFQDEMIDQKRKLIKSLQKEKK